jgi:hypothetical protein
MKFYDTKAIEETARLIADDEVEKSGIYLYILTRDERYLELHVF